VSGVISDLAVFSVHSYSGSSPERTGAAGVMQHVLRRAPSHSAGWAEWQSDVEIGLTRILRSLRHFWAMLPRTLVLIQIKVGNIISSYASLALTMASVLILLDMVSSSGHFVMTSEEQRRQKADILLARVEAQADLQRLLTKAATLGDTLCDLGARFKNLRHANATGNAERDILTLPKAEVAEVLEPEILMALTQAILDARERLREVEQRKSDLGL
jgi:hypothetical protein